MGMARGRSAGRMKGPSMEPVDTNPPRAEDRAQGGVRSGQRGRTVAGEAGAHETEQGKHVNPWTWHQRQESAGLWWDTSSGRRAAGQ